MTKSEQARADALADAETLRWIRQRNPVNADQLVHGLRFAAPWPEEIIFSEARHAARAAFRAVPGLRG